MSRDREAVSAVSLEFEGKTPGLTHSNLSKTKIARFCVHEEGLRLKVVHNGCITYNHLAIIKWQILSAFGCN